MFIQILDDIYNQVRHDIQRRYSDESQASFDIKLNFAIHAWCNQLIPQNQHYISSYILQWGNFYEFRDLTNYIYEEWKPKERQKLFTGEKYWETSKLYKSTNLVFILTKMRVGSMKFIVILAFLITAVGYFIYLINHQKQQSSTDNQKQPVRDSISSPPPVPKITRQFLILVVSASKVDILESLKMKGEIDINDAESLYEITSYLCLLSETDFFQEMANINQYFVNNKDESEYDIYLIQIELCQTDEGFKPNVDQLARYDAFRKLVNLAIDFKISPRLQMEAYGNLDVYSR